MSLPPDSSFTASPSPVAPARQMPMLSWRLNDIERKLFFPAGRQTQPNFLLSLLIGLGLTVSFYGLLIAIKESTPYLYAIMAERQWTPYAVTGFFFWGCASLFIKWRKLALQRRSLSIQVVPEHSNFVLSPLTVDPVLKSLYEQVDDPESFTLFNRVRRALMSLKNMGRVSDVDTVLQAQADGDHHLMESSYTLLKAFCWAMPVLGFIGTVQGLSGSIGQFGSALAQNVEVAALRDSLKQVVGQLSVAFDTTLVALIATLSLQMLISLFRKREDDFLTDCDDYCHRSIITKLRLLSHEEPE